MPGNGAMKPLSLGLTDSRSLRKALKVLSSEDLLMLNEEIEAIALERIEEEEIKGVKASERGQVIDSFREKLGKVRISTLCAKTKKFSHLISII